MKKATVFTCVLLVLGLFVLTAGCGDGGETSTPGAPDEVAEAFWAAALKGDADASWEMLSKNVQAGLEDKAKWSESVRNDPNASVQAGKATVTGDTSTVPVKILSSGEEVYTSDVSLVKEDGEWKVQIP
jgi:hypothetical protein